jgi:hypothetical protein
MGAYFAGSAGRMSPASITQIRNDREARARRRLELARLLRDAPQATNVDLAKAFNVDRHTITSDRLGIMAEVNQNALTETQLYREVQLSRIQEKWDSIEKGNMSDSEKHREWRGWMKLEVALRGTAAPSRSENLTLNADVEAVGPFRKWVKATRGLNEQQVDQLLVAAEKTPRKAFAMVEPPKTSPLWNKKQLTEGDHEVA